MLYNHNMSLNSFNFFRQQKKNERWPRVIKSNFKLLLLWLHFSSLKAGSIFYVYYVKLMVYETVLYFWLEH